MSCCEPAALEMDDVEIEDLASLEALARASWVACAKYVLQYGSPQAIVQREAFRRIHDHLYEARRELTALFPDEL